MLRTRESEGYGGDIVWEKDGAVYSTSAGTHCADGAGCNRAYNNRVKSTQSCLVANSGITQKPIALIHSQVSSCVYLKYKHIYAAYTNFTCFVLLQIECRRCTLARTKRINEHEEATGETVTIDRYSEFSREHQGRCYRNSNLNPVSAEEPQSEILARNLLLDSNGVYRGDDIAIFSKEVVTDNDTKSRAKFIATQTGIIGEAAVGVADHSPDAPHVFKCTSNKLYSERAKDASLRGGNYLLTNQKIKSIHCDARHAIEEYHPNVGDCVARNTCLKQIGCIIRHHCGDHSRCIHAKYCTYLEVKNEHPTWSDAQIVEEAASRSKRKGPDMQLSQKGIAKLEGILLHYFNEKSIDRIARLATGNASEGFFSRVTKFSEGKKNKYNQTDIWKAILEIALCRAGDAADGQSNVSRTHEQIACLLGISITSVERKAMEREDKKRRSDIALNKQPKAKARRSRQCMMKAVQMEKQERSKNKHKSGKLLTKHSGKSTKKKAVPRCGCCNQPGHTATKCPMPKKKKRKKMQLIDWITNDGSEDVTVSTGKKRKIDGDLIEW